MTASRTVQRAGTPRTAWSRAATGDSAVRLWRVVVAGLLVMGGASVGWAQDGVLEAAVAAAAAIEVSQDQDRPEHAEEGEHDESRITDEYIPLFVEGFPKRPKPLIELGQPFLGTGNIGSGFTIPGGAVWTPRFRASHYCRHRLGRHLHAGPETLRRLSQGHGRGQGSKPRRRYLYLQLRHRHGGFFLSVRRRSRVA